MHGHARCTPRSMIGQRGTGDESPSIVCDNVHPRCHLLRRTRRQLREQKGTVLTGAIPFAPTPWKYWRCSTVPRRAAIAAFLGRWHRGRLWARKERSGMTRRRSPTLGHARSTRVQCALPSDDQACEHEPRNCVNGSTLQPNCTLRSAQHSLMI